MLETSDAIEPVYPAATVVLVRDGGAGLEALLVQPLSHSWPQVPPYHKCQREPPQRKRRKTSRRSAQRTP